MLTHTQLETLTTAYIEAALLDMSDPMHTQDDIEPDALAAMRADCERFAREHAADIADDPETAGYDLWDTRNRAGAGFWDGDWAEDVGQRLTRAAHALGECSLYVTDEGTLALFAG